MNPLVDGVLPVGWRRAKTNEMGEVLAGKALNAEGPGNQRPYLRTKNVLDGRIDLSDVLSMPFTDAEFDRFRLLYGDVLLNEGQSLELVGRCSIYRDEHAAPCAMQNQLLRFRARASTDPEYAAHLFRLCQQSGIFASIATQTTSVAHLGSSRFAHLALPWPPLSEQRAIAAALSDVDALISALDQLIAKKRDLKTATMQKLLTGERRLPGFTGAWSSEPLGSLGSWFSGGTPAMANPTYWGGSIPWVSPKDMKVARIFDAQDHVTARALGNGTRLLPPGALMVVVRGMILAHSLPVARAERPVAFNQDIKGLVVHERISSDFILWWLISHEAQLLGMTTESTHGTKRMDTETLFAVKVPVPPRKEQDAIAEILTDMDDELGALEARSEKTRLIKQGMMQELLTGRTRLVEAAR